MPFSAEIKMEEFRARCEGREGIYVEKGVVCVRVSNIGWDAGRLNITARVEEIPTDGFPVEVFYLPERDESNSLSWTIGAGHLTMFSKHTWNMGNGGWCIFFSAEIVDGVVALAREFPEELRPFQGYREVLSISTIITPMSRPNACSANVETIPPKNERHVMEN
jgi:hypothetical protein